MARARGVSFKEVNRSRAKLSLDDSRLFLDSESLGIRGNQLDKEYLGCGW